MLANLTWGEAPVLPHETGLDAEDLGGSATHDLGLHPEEVALARTLPVARRGTFIAGRMALRLALQKHGHSGDAPILRTARGAPTLPSDLAGSIAHKRTLAVAAVAVCAPSHRHIGIDLEHRPTEVDLRRPSIARRILLDSEQQRVTAIAESALHQRELELVHFALKESVYKAIDPIVQRYVGFLEVELQLALATPDSGTASVRLHMPEFATTSAPLQAAWRCTDEWILAAATLGEP